MYRIFFILLDIIVVAIFTVPIGFFFQHFFTERTKKRKLIFILFSLYLIAVFSAVGIPDIRSLVFDPSLNIIPIIDITNSPISYIRNELLNILLFVPLGIFLPVIWSQDLFTLKRTVVFGLGLSFLIEVSQLFTFRLTDIDDIIHFLRREMLDFTAFPVFFVSNLLLVQRKKYYFNRAMVSRNCSIVL